MHKILTSHSGSARAVIILLVSLATIVLAFYFHFYPVEMKGMAINTTIPDISAPSLTSAPPQAPAHAPAPTLAPAVQVAAAPEPVPAPKINISGDWSFDWGNTPSEFRISHVGNSFSGKSNYDPGVMVVKGSVTGNCVDGTWELIGNPSGHFQGEFHITSLDETAGEGSWITYENGPPSSRLIINKI